MSEIKATLALKSTKEGPEPSRIELREDAVVGVVNEGIMGQSRVLIPLDAIDSAFTGWFRLPEYLVSALVLLILGLLILYGVSPISLAFVLFAVTSFVLTALWYTSPTKIETIFGSQGLTSIMFLVVGLPILGSEDNTLMAIGLIALSLVLFVIFWSLRPAKIVIRSGSQRISGVPISVTEGEAFAKLVLLTVYRQTLLLNADVEAGAHRSANTQDTTVSSSHSETTKPAGWRPAAFAILLVATVFGLYFVLSTGDNFQGNQGQSVVDTAVEQKPKSYYTETKPVHPMQVGTQDGAVVSTEALRKACEGGDAQSCWLSGYRFGQGIDTIPSLIQSYRYYAKACEMGNHLACVFWGKYLTRADIDQAHSITNKACKNGEASGCAWDPKNDERLVDQAELRSQLEADCYAKPYFGLSCLLAAFHQPNLTGIDAKTHRLKMKMCREQQSKTACDQLVDLYGEHGVKLLWEGCRKGQLSACELLSEIQSGGALPNELPFGLGSSDLLKLACAYGKSRACSTLKQAGVNQGLDTARLCFLSAKDACPTAKPDDYSKISVDGRLSPVVFENAAGQIYAAFLDSNEVTVGHRRARQSGRTTRARGSRYPAVFWNRANPQAGGRMAERYCKNRGGRLPTSAEWRQLARWGEDVFPGVYPAKSRKRLDRVCRRSDDVNFGLCDALSNVTEWVSAESSDRRGSYMLAGWTYNESVPAKGRAKAGVRAAGLVSVKARRQRSSKTVIGAVRCAFDVNVDRSELDLANLTETITSPAVVSPQATTKKQPAHMIIVSGSRDRGEAKQQFDSYKQLGVTELDGYPKLIDSSTVEGLNPGYWIVVVAAPKEKQVARELVERFNTLQKGAYFREVKIETPQDIQVIDLFPR